MRIMIVEDDLYSRKIMLKFMERYGTCSGVRDGLEAVAAFMEVAETDDYFGLVLLDIFMPNIDGIQTLRIIRDYEENKGISKDRRTVVVMMTAINDQKTIEDCESLGIGGYFTKPIDLNELGLRLQALGFDRQP